LEYTLVIEVCGIAFIILVLGHSTAIVKL